jgi:hypothetical protein
MTYRQVLDLDADTVLRKMRLESAKRAYQSRLHELLNPTKS